MQTQAKCRHATSSKARSQTSRKDAVNSDVTITASGGKAVAAIITNSSVDRLGLAVGKPAAAMFKASSVTVGVEGSA